MSQKSCVQTAVAACQRKPADGRTDGCCDLCPRDSHESSAHPHAVCQHRLADHSALHVRFTAQTDKHSFSFSSQLTCHVHRPPTVTYQTSESPEHKHLCCTADFFLFLYFEDVASILRPRAGEQIAIRPIAARPRETKHAPLNSNSITFTSGKPGFPEGSSTLFRLKSLEHSTYCD